MKQNIYWMDRLHQWAHEIVILRYKGRKRQETGPSGLLDVDFKYLATPIWSWFDLVETAGGDCCSPKSVKINKDAILAFFPLPGSSCFCHWGSLADCSICLFFRLHNEAPTRFIRRVAKKFIQPQWYNLKSKAIFWKVVLLDNLNAKVCPPKSRIWMFTGCLS